MTRVQVAPSYMLQHENDLTQTSKIIIFGQLSFNGKAEIISFKSGFDMKICSYSMILSSKVVFTLRLFSVRALGLRLEISDCLLEISNGGSGSSRDDGAKNISSSWLIQCTQM